LVNRRDVLKGAVLTIGALTADQVADLRKVWEDSAPGGLEPIPGASVVWDTPPFPTIGSYCLTRRDHADGTVSFTQLIYDGKAWVDPFPVPNASDA
jgi:hypothetical protein